jgi:hypothetical protein
MNELYRQLGQANPQMNSFMDSFENFRKTIKGNPQQQVQQLLNSGRVSQAQYNAAVQRAQGLMKLLKL